MAAIAANVTLQDALAGARECNPVGLKRMRLNDESTDWQHNEDDRQRQEHCQSWTPPAAQRDYGHFITRRMSAELQHPFVKSGLQSQDDQREEKQRARGNVSRAKIVKSSELCRRLDRIDRET